MQGTRAHSHEVVGSWAKENFCPSCSPKSSNAPLCSFLWVFDVTSVPVCTCSPEQADLDFHRLQALCGTGVCGVSHQDSRKEEWLWNLQFGCCRAEGPLVSARLGSCPFPLSLSCISSWSLGYVLVQGKRKREGMIFHQLYCNWTSFSKRHSIFSPKFLSLFTAGLLAKHLTFFDSFLIWDVWIATYVLLNFQNDHLDQRSKSWAHLCDVKGELNRIYDGLACTPTISSHGMVCCDFQLTKPPNCKYIICSLDHTSSSLFSKSWVESHAQWAEHFWNKITNSHQGFLTC